MTEINDIELTASLVGMSSPHEFDLGNVCEGLRLKARDFLLFLHWILHENIG